jgi:ribonuclease Z
MLSVTFLGTGASCPTVDRNVAGLAVQREGEMILFDCGEGSQRQMMRYGVGFSFTEVFFTHYHADHMLGITGLIRTMGLQDRTAPVVLYGPRGAERVLGAAVMLGIERNKFPVEIVEIRPGHRLARPEYDIVTFETEHRADTVGYALAEHTRLGRFHPERARELGIPEGPLWGRLHRGETVTLDDGRVVRPEDLVGTPRRGRTVVYSGDTRPHLPLIEAARGADLLVHEATFMAEEAERAGETGHSTARGAAELAAEAGVHLLALTHLSPRYSGGEIRDEGRAAFENTIVPQDFDRVELPFPERGHPVHVRAESHG